MDKLSIPSMLCMYGSRCFSQDDPRWSDMTILYAMWWDAMAIVYKLIYSLFLCLKAYSFSLFWPLCEMHKPRWRFCICGNNLVTQDMIWWYQYDMVCMQWKGGSLMCTSNVAGNTQMASLDRQVTQNGLGVNNAIARGIYNGVVEVTVLCDDE